MLMTFPDADWKEGKSFAPLKKAKLQPARKVSSGLITQPIDYYGA